MNKFKNGEEVYVSDMSESHALELKNKRVFIGMDGDYFICKTCSTAQCYRWSHVAKIPAKKTIPWTKDTCPALPFVLKDKKNKWEGVVNYVDEYCVVCVGAKYSFSELLRICDYLPEPKNKELVLPCGKEINE